MTKMTLEGGIFLVTNIKLVGGIARKSDEANPNDYHPEMVAAAPASAAVTANVTVQVKDDPEEYARAEKVREQIRKMLADVASTQTPIGLMAPHGKQVEMDQAIADARASAEAYNKTAKRTFVYPWIVQMSLRADDATLKQVASEVRGLLAEMDEGVKKRDADAIREAARKAKLYAEMMDEEHGKKVLAAIEEMRASAREVAKAVKERGDAAIGEVLACDNAYRKAALNDARAAFLDVETGEAKVEAIPVQSARALDVGEDGGDEGGDGFVEKVGVEETTPDDVDANRAVDEDAMAAGYATDDAMEV